MATSSEERLAVLRLLQEGKITPQEAKSCWKLWKRQRRRRLLRRQGPSWLHIRITGLDDAESAGECDVAYDDGASGLELGSRFGSELEGLGPELLATFLAQGEPGVLIDMVDEKDHERIEVFLD